MDKFEQERLDKLQKIREMGIEPYGKRYDNTQSIKSILDSFVPERTDIKVRGCRAHFDLTPAWENCLSGYKRLDGKDTSLHKTR